MNPNKMNQQQVPQQELACPILSAAALIQGGPKTNLLSCIREKCGFYNVVGMVGPDGKPMFIAGCGITQLASFMAATHQTLANATAPGEGMTAAEPSTAGAAEAAKEEPGVAIHIKKH